MEKFNKIAPLIFEERAGKIYIGGQQVTEQMRGILRDQAQNLLTTQLWETLYASVLNEAYDIALRQSQTFEHSLNAKMLYHWNHYIRNVIIRLAKEN